jgi:hypothetical protein
VRQARVLTQGSATGTLETGAPFCAADPHRIDPAYGAIVTRRGYAGLTLGVVMFLSLTGFIVVMGMLTGENWCEDRWPWWGPPEDPGSTCTGHSWARKHPGEYPWTMPR